MACSLDDQTTEANKLVDEANIVVRKNNEVSGKATDLFNELMGENISKSKSADDYREKNKSKFDELVSLSEQSDKLGAESVDKFEQASKMKISEEFKEYLEHQNQGLRKVNETRNLMTVYAKEFLQTKDADKINKQLNDYEKKRTDAEKETDELTKKIAQFEKDHPALFQK